MKAKFFIPLIVISFVLFSCNSGIFSGTQGSVSFDTTGAADYISQNAARSIVSFQANDTYDESKFDSYTIKVKIETEGDYVDSAENVYSKKLSEILAASNQEKAVAEFIKESLSQPISIRGIPTGSRIKVKLSISNTVSLDKEAFKQSLSGNQLSQTFIDALVDSIVEDNATQNNIWEGESESLVIKKGENKVNIKIKGFNPNDYIFEEDEANIFLYSNTSYDVPGVGIVQNSGIYSFPSKLLTSKKILTPEVFLTNDGFSDFVIDKDNNVYYVVFGEFDDIYRTTPFYIYKNNTIIIYSDQGEQEEFLGIYLEPNTGLLFYALYNYGDSYNINAYDTTSGETISNIASGVIPTYEIYDYAITFGEPTQTEDGLVYEGYSFIAKIRRQNGDHQSWQFQKTPIKYIVSQTGKRIETYGSELWADLYSRSPDLTDSLSEYARITDMTVQNNTFYALLKEVIPLNDEYDKTFNVDAPIQMNTIKSRGALISIDITHFDDASAMMVLSDASIVSQTKISVPFEFLNPSTSNNDQTTVDFTVYQPGQTSAFFGPEKFISLSSGKLVIADDGYFYYKDNNDQFHIKNVNQVVEVKL